MENLSHGKQVLLMTISELAFAVVAVPLYVFLVLPNHPQGALPGIVPLVGAGAGVVPSVLATLGFLALALTVSVTLYWLFGNSHFYSKDLQVMVDDFSDRDFVPVYLAAGIGEEALFRWALLEPCGLVVSSLLFCVLHVAYWRKPLMMAYVFACGLIFGGLYLYTQSLLLCALAHAAYNIVLSVLLKRKVITPRG